MEGEIEKLTCPLEVIEKIPVKVFRDFLHCSEWHHTSSHYNRTEFYELDVKRISRLTKEEVDQLIADYKKERAEKKARKSEPPKEDWWYCTYLFWSGSRAHPHADEYCAIGVIRGNWFYLPNGSKKSISSRGFEKHCCLDSDTFEEWLVEFKDGRRTVSCRGVISGDKFYPFDIKCPDVARYPLTVTDKECEFKKIKKSEEK
jgi:hypothetical protein